MVISRRRMAMSTAFVVLAATGCGSTVASRPGESGLAVGAAQSAQGSLGAAPGSLGVGATASAASGPAGSPVSHSSSSGLAPTVPADSVARQAAVDERGVSGPGWDARHIYLGIDYVPPQAFDAAANSVGFSALTVSDDKALVTALISQVNAAGGVLGRTVVPVFYDDSTSSDTTTAAEASCAYFAEDRRVMAVVSLPPSWNCLAKHHVPSANAGNQELVDAAYMKLLDPYFYAPTAFSMTQLTPLYLDRLTAEGYFPAKAKIGIVYDSGTDAQTEDRDAKEMQRQLVARGVDVAATFAVDDTSVSSTASGEANAVLPFRAKGVDHVISLDGSVAYFMTAAEQQNYRPRYAVSTYLSPNSVLETVPPKAQLKGAVGVGWSPATDVDSRAETAPVPAGEARCDKARRASGQTAGGLARFVDYSYCDAIYLFLDAARAAGGLSPGSLRAGADLLGGGFQSALTFRPAYSPTRSDGSSALRDLSYVDSCSCFRYSSSRLYP
jgi:ABC-type branched-subunit amino acid transport system substrate-binding protein